jgi:hypothetical protein
MELAIVLRTKEPDLGSRNVVKFDEELDLLAIFAEKYPSSNSNSSDTGGTIHSHNRCHVLVEQCTLHEIITVW